MNMATLKRGDTVEFTGWSIEQVRWGNNDTPDMLIEGRFYVVDSVDVRSHHTKVRVEGFDGWFNSVHFQTI